MPFRILASGQVSKFKNLDHYDSPTKSGYRLLPCRFTRLNESKTVLTNDVGEYLVLHHADIQRFVEHSINPQEEIYKSLKSKHFLIDDDSDIAIDLLALKQRTKLQRLSDFTSLHMFVASLRCEHSCPYCQVSRQSDNKTAFDMSVDTANKATDLVFRSPSPSVKIEFQGGEPLVNFEIIQHVVDRAETHAKTIDKDVQFVIATNLALITDEILSYMDQHDILVSTSLDGPAALHNKNRPRPGNDSYERAIAGIHRVREAVGRDRVSALMTTTKASLSQVTEIIDEYLRQDFDGIFLRPLSPYGFAVKTKWFASYDYQEWLDFYFRGLDYIIQLNKNGQFFVEQYAATILTKILTPYEPGYVDLMNPAGIGIAAVVYNYDGDVYASDEGRMLAEMQNKTFRLGNVHDDTYEEIFSSDALLDPIEESFGPSVPMCNECAFLPWCGSDPVYHQGMHGDYVGLKTTSAFCNRNMAIFKGLIERMENDPEVMTVFSSWVG